MKQLDILPLNNSIDPASTPQLETAHHLIVLVPETETDPALLARKIRELANTVESRVQLLGICPSPMREPGIRRRLITLAAMVASPNIFVEWNIAQTGHWLSAIRPYWQHGDVIVCFEDKSRAVGKPLRQILSSNMDAAIYVIRDSLAEEKTPPAWLSVSLSWAGSVILIAGFFLLQGRLILSHGWFQQTLLYGSLLAEGLSIWAWNDFMK